MSNIIYRTMFFELWMRGVIVSAMIYRGVLSLSLSYILLLLETSHDISQAYETFYWYTYAHGCDQYRVITTIPETYHSLIL